MAEPTKTPRYHWYDVPAGTPETACKGCGYPIYWVKTPKGANCPVDCDTVSGSTPPFFGEPGKGVSHFQTCSKAGDFSGQGRR